MANDYFNYDLYNQMGGNNMLGGGQGGGGMGMGGFNMGGMQAGMGMGGQLGSWLAGLFAPDAKWTNPADASMPYLNQVPDELKNAFGPYMQAGQSGLSQYLAQMQGLGTTGGAKNAYNELGAGFEGSPGLQFLMDQMTKAGNAGAAASGMGGSPAVQAALQKNAYGLASQDFGNYMNNVMGLYGQGLGGLGDLSHMGQQSSSQYGEDMVQNLLAKAGLTYSGGVNQNQYEQQKAQQAAQKYGGIGGLLGTGLGALAGGFLF